MSVPKLLIGLVACLSIAASGCGDVPDDDADDDTTASATEPETDPDSDFADGEGAPLGTSESALTVAGSDLVEATEEISGDDVPAGEDSAARVGASALNHAKRLARTKVWKSRVRCNAPVTTSSKALSGRVLAVASYKYNPQDPSVFTDCHITYDDNWHSWSWARLCTVTVHEFGHLSGRGHSKNPKSIMYYAPRNFTGAARRCRR